MSSGKVSTAAPGSRDFLSRFPQLFFTPSGNQHRGAERCKLQRRCLAQPRSTARYDDRLILENWLLKNTRLLFLDLTIAEHGVVTIFVLRVVAWRHEQLNA